RSLVGRAGVTLYRVGSVKRSGAVTYAAIDGGMSDNPRPQLYGARYEALLANRSEQPPAGEYRIARNHGGSCHVLRHGGKLPEPRLRRPVAARVVFRSLARPSRAADAHAQSRSRASSIPLRWLGLPRSARCGPFRPMMKMITSSVISMSGSLTPTLDALQSSH